PDGNVHAAKGFHFYSTFSLWDTFRAKHPLLTVIEPERAGRLRPKAGRVHWSGLVRPPLHPRHLRPDRPARPRERVVPPRSLSVRLGRVATADRTARPANPSDAVRRHAGRHLRQRQLRPDVR